MGVVHIRAKDAKVAGDPSFLEPQPSVSRDLSQIIFAGNVGEIDSYVVGVPVWVLD